jgi:hypothetical protein
MKRITFFPNGLTVVSDEKGDMIQNMPLSSWVQVYLAYLANEGFDPTQFEIELPYYGLARVCKDSVESGPDRYRWQFERTELQSLNRPWEPDRK